MRTTAILIPALLAASLSAAAPAMAAPATCQGQVATITFDASADSSSQVTGTVGNDVISTTGYVEIDALDGDDVICMEKGYASGGPGDDSVQVTGSSAGESADIRYAEDLDISMGGGKDFVILQLTTGGTGQVNGGSGADKLVINNTKSIVADLKTRQLKLDAAGEYTLRSFADVQAAARQVTLRGDNKANALSGIGTSCKIKISGRAGSDDLRVHANGYDFGYSENCGTRSTLMSGGGGNDYMRGGNTFKDVLNGGAGRDTADGRDGIDTCRAEVRQRCER